MLKEAYYIIQTVIIMEFTIHKSMLFRLNGVPSG